MQASEPIAFCTSVWLGWLSICAIRPKPQLSCSKSGEYSVPSSQRCRSMFRQPR
jgi:hypothetical protein